MRSVWARLIFIFDYPANERLPENHQSSVRLIFATCIVANEETE
jgi:hypothetical protein